MMIYQRNCRQVWVGSSRYTFVIRINRYYYEDVANKIKELE